MVEITYSPLKSLVVHDILEVDKESIMRGRVTPAGTMPLYWCLTYHSPSAFSINALRSLCFSNDIATAKRQNAEA